jgi:hypothetical protein
VKKKSKKGTQKKIYNNNKTKKKEKENPVVIKMCVGLLACLNLKHKRPSLRTWHSFFFLFFFLNLKTKINRWRSYLFFSSFFISRWENQFNSLKHNTRAHLDRFWRKFKKIVAAIFRKFKWKTKEKHFDRISFFFYVLFPLFFFFVCELISRTK